MGGVVDLQEFRLRQAARRTGDASNILACASHDLRFCGVRYFVRTNRSGRPRRCCCGRVYNGATLGKDAGIFRGIARDTLGSLSSQGTMTTGGPVSALLAHGEITSVERKACASCLSPAERLQQLSFLWGLYLTYRGRAASASPAPGAHAEMAAGLSCQSPVDVRGHNRRGIGLIRHFERKLALCPWAGRGHRAPARSPLRVC